MGAFNADGRPDLVAANCADDTASVLLGQGDGTFVTAATLPVGRAPGAVVTADFDGDGRSDFATANADEDTVTLWTGIPQVQRDGPAKPLLSGVEAVAENANHNLPSSTDSNSRLCWGSFQT